MKHLIKTQKESAGSNFENKIAKVTDFLFQNLKNYKTCQKPKTGR